MCFGHKAKAVAPALNTQPTEFSDMKQQQKFQRESAAFTEEQRGSEKECQKQAKKYRNEKHERLHHCYGFNIGNLSNRSPSFSPGVSL